MSAVDCSIQSLIEPYLRDFLVVAEAQHNTEPAAQLQR